MSIVPVVCFAHIIHFYLNVIIFHGKYKLWTSSKWKVIIILLLPSC
jgi:hypothetical protein